MALFTEYVSDATKSITRKYSQHYGSPIEFLSVCARMAYKFVNKSNNFGELVFHQGATICVDGSDIPTQAFLMAKTSPDFPNNQVIINGFTNICFSGKTFALRPKIIGIEGGMASNAAPLTIINVRTALQSPGSQELYNHVCCTMLFFTYVFRTFNVTPEQITSWARSRWEGLSNGERRAVTAKTLTGTEVQPHDFFLNEEQEAAMLTNALFLAPLDLMETHVRPFYAFVGAFVPIKQTMVPTDAIDILEDLDIMELFGEA